MNIREYDYILDVRKSKEYNHVELVQYDKETNVFNITLEDNTKTYNIDDLDIIIVFRKANTEVVTQGTADETLTVEDNVIRCILKPKVLDVAGPVLAEVKLIDNEQMLTSQEFTFRVRQSI